MQMKRLGRSDIMISRTGLGTMTWGQQNTEAEAHQQLDAAIDFGVNFIDAAEMYPIPPRAETQGRTETYIGTWLKARGRRDKVVLATKIVGPGERVAHVRGGNLKHDAKALRDAVEGSLTRLQTDYIDLYQIHWPERVTNYFGKLGYKHKADEVATPPEETFKALTDLVNEGKIRQIGLSNETPWGVMKYLGLGDSHGGPRVASIQNPYSLVNRTFEIGLAEIAMREQVGLIAYSPLAFGHLSGKYLGGAKPEGARVTLWPEFARYGGAQTQAAVARYVQLARDHGLDPAQMALAYVLGRPFLSSCLIGATTMAQLTSNLDSSNLTLSADLEKEIEAIQAEIPNPAP